MRWLCDWMLSGYYGNHTTKTGAVINVVAPVFLFRGESNAPVKNDGYYAERAVCYSVKPQNNASRGLERLGAICSMITAFTLRISSF